MGAKNKNVCLMDSWKGCFVGFFVLHVDFCKVFLLVSAFSHDKQEDNKLYQLNIYTTCFSE